MIHIVTESGFEADIDESIKNSMEMVDILAEIDDGSTMPAFGLSRLCTLVLGKEQKKKLYAHLREESGNVPVDKVEAALTEILDKLGGEVKN